MQCEMCGKKQAEYKCMVEEIELAVCENCSKYGEEKKQIRKQAKPTKATSADTKQITTRERTISKPQQSIVEDYAELVKKAREKNKMTQAELAKAIAEKETILHKIESGRMAPSVTIAKKLERFLGIKLIEISPVGVYAERKNVALTVGDVIRVRQRK